MNEELNKLFETMSQGETPDLFQVLGALNALPDIVTLDHRPAAAPATTLGLPGMQKLPPHPYPYLSFLNLAHPGDVAFCIKCDIFSCEKIL